MRRLHLAWAAVPAFLAGLLVYQSLREDTYIADGSSYWQTHPDGRVWVVTAVAIDLVAAAVLVASRGQRLRWIVGGVLTVVGLLATVAAGLAISSN